MTDLPTWMQEARKLREATYKIIEQEVLRPYNPKEGPPREPGYVAHIVKRHVERHIARYDRALEAALRTIEAHIALLSADKTLELAAEKGGPSAVLAMLELVEAGKQVAKAQAALNAALKGGGVR